MALKKQIEVRGSGVNAEYLRVEDIQLVSSSNELRISVGLYINKAARDSGKNPIDILNISINGAKEMTLVGNNLIEMTYNKIKELESFSDAVDV
jgi:hypothetical protein